MKRIAALLFALVIVVTCFSFCATASSESYSGVYNGYNYYCACTVTTSYLHAEMMYSNSSPTIKILGDYHYIDTNQHSQSRNIVGNGHTSLLKTPNPPDLDHYTSANPDYYVGGTKILSISLTP